MFIYGIFFGDSNARLGQELLWLEQDSRKKENETYKKILEVLEKVLIVRSQNI